MICSDPTRSGWIGVDSDSQDVGIPTVSTAATTKSGYFENVESNGSGIPRIAVVVCSIISVTSCIIGCALFLCRWMIRKDLALYALEPSPSNSSKQANTKKKGLSVRHIDDAWKAQRVRMEIKRHIEDALYDDDLDDDEGDGLIVTTLSKARSDTLATDTNDRNNEDLYKLNLSEEDQEEEEDVRALITPGPPPRRNRRKTPGPPPRKRRKASESIHAVKAMIEEEQQLNPLSDGDEEHE